jgi:hypothetical protein
MQLDVDIGSSSVARGVVNLVVGYLSKLVIELAFLIQVKLAWFLCWSFVSDLQTLLITIPTSSIVLSKADLQYV